MLSGLPLKALSAAGRGHEQHLDRHLCVTVSHVLFTADTEAIRINEFTITLRQMVYERAMAFLMYRGVGTIIYTKFTNRFNINRMIASSIQQRTYSKISAIHVVTECPGASF